MIYSKNLLPLITKATRITQNSATLHMNISSSPNFIYQYPTYTFTVQDMQPKIIIREYMLELIIVNFHLIFLPLSSGSRYLCP